MAWNHCGGSTLGRSQERWLAARPTATGHFGGSHHDDQPVLEGSGRTALGLAGGRWHPRGQLSPERQSRAAA
jgi:hypothetical protein